MEVGARVLAVILEKNSLSQYNLTMNNTQQVGVVAGKCQNNKIVAGGTSQ